MSVKTDNMKTLVNALEEIERLRGRCAELESSRPPKFEWRKRVEKWSRFLDGLKTAPISKGQRTTAASIRKEIDRYIEYGIGAVESDDMNAAESFCNAMDLDTIGLPSGCNAEAWLLRKQAEAVEVMADFHDEDCGYLECLRDDDLKEFAGDCVREMSTDDIRDYAQRLRTQADELEAGGGE